MLRKTLELGLLNLVSYFVLTVDFRSVAQANIVWSIVTNLVIALITFSILKRVHEASTLRRPYCVRNRRRFGDRHRYRTDAEMLRQVKDCHAL
jgi:hypothetical protein